MKIKVHVKCHRHRLDVLKITTSIKRTHLANPMLVLVQFYGFDLPSGDLDVSARSKITFQYQNWHGNHNLTYV